MSAAASHATSAVNARRLIAITTLVAGERGSAFWGLTRVGFFSAGTRRSGARLSLSLTFEGSSGSKIGSSSSTSSSPSCRPSWGHQAGSLSIPFRSVQIVADWQGQKTSRRTNGRTTPMSDAIAHFGRIPKTLHILRLADESGYRRTIKAHSNLQEGRHALARLIFHGKHGHLYQRYHEGMEDQLGALGLVLNAVVLFNTRYTNTALDKLRAESVPRGSTCATKTWRGSRRSSASTSTCWAAAPSPCPRCPKGCVRWAPPTATSTRLKSEAFAGRKNIQPGSFLKDDSVDGSFPFEHSGLRLSCFSRWAGPGEPVAHHEQLDLMATCGPRIDILLISPTCEAS